MKKIFKFILAATFIIAAFSIKAQVSQPQPDTADFPYWIDMMQDPDVNFFQTVKAFEAYWENREITRGSGFKPFKRWENTMRQRVSSSGERPAPDREIKALENFKAQTKNREIAGDWTALGPFKVPSGYNGYRGLGRVNAIAFHPEDENHFYIGAPSGGLWVTLDHGESWEVLTDHLPTLGISAIVVNYDNPDQILIGTGDRDANDAPGLGVWRSDDGGINWNPSNDGMGNSTVGRMIQHPENPDIILAAASNGIFISENAGISWSQTQSGNFKEIVFKPDEPEVVYASSSGKFFRSENMGNNFTQITNGLPGSARGVIGVSEANPEVVYFLMTNSDTFKGIYRSDDSGLTFSVRSTSPNIMGWDCYGGGGGQAWYDLDIAVDPLDENTIIAGGVNSFKSTNGGTTWNISSHWWGDCGVTSVHADLHVLEYSPVNGKLFAGNDGGVYWTEDGGIDWHEISDGLVISQAYKLGQSATNPDLVIQGYQDNGSSTYVGDTHNWINVGGGDGMECAFDPADHRYSYSTIYFGDINRLYNHNYQGKIAGNNTNGITESGAWVTPFLIDHEDGNIMFIGYRNVWRSTNVKAGNVNNVQWQKISTMSNTDMNVLVQSRANTDILYAASGSKLFFTENAKDNTVNWVSRTSALPTSDVVTAIETSPFDENIVYLAQQTRLYKSEDKGLSWRNISANLSNIQINSIAHYKNSQEGLYLGTDIGVFFKDALMDEWINFGNNLPANATVTELEFYYDPETAQGDMLRAATFGRGTWSSPPFFSILEADFTASETELPAYCSVDFTDLTIGSPLEWFWSFPGGTPSTSTERNPQGIQYNEAGVYSVTLMVSNPLGTDTKQKTDFIMVTEAQSPEIAFGADQQSGCTGMEVQFADLSENCPDSWTWSFEPTSFTFVEGSTANDQNPVVQFNEDADYTVSLTASNPAGANSLTLENFIHTGGEAIPFEADFDAQSLSETGWTLENPDGGRSWELTSLGDEHGVWMNFFNYTNMGTRDYMISPVLNFRNFDQVFLRFDYAYAQRYMQKDSLIVSISDDCGLSWERVYANGPDGEGVFETAEPTTAFFEALSSGDWCGQGYGAPCPMIDLSDWAGKSNLQIRFEAYNNYGNNLYIKNIAISNITGQNLHSLNKECLIYPIPANDRLYIELANGAENSQVQLTDLTGRALINQNFKGNSYALDISELPNGSYLMTISQGEKVFNRKFIISR